jgi:hypothetical protein
LPARRGWSVGMSVFIDSNSRPLQFRARRPARRAAAHGNDRQLPSKHKHADRIGQTDP